MSGSNYIEDAILNHIRGGTAFGQPAGLYTKLHTGDPGEDCTANASAETTRKATTFAASSGGSMAANGTLPSWTSWVAGAETISHFSIWDSSTSGNPLGSGSWASAKLMANGDTFAPSAMTWSLD